MPWDLKPDRPIYAQLVEELELRICAGIYPPGSKLDTVRDLAQEAAVNPNTMQKALARLEEEGLVYTQRTSGRYVTEDVNMINQVKSKLAKEQVEDFLKKMENLGYDKKDTLELIKSILEGKENG